MEVEKENFSDGEELKCEGCGKIIKGKVKDYLIENPQAFEGQALCFQCQQKYKKKKGRDHRDEKKYGEVVEEGNKKLTSLPQIRDVVENDIVEIFGDTGVGKSRLVHQFAKDVIRNKESVLYIDTERNLGSDEKIMIGDYYVYTPQLQGLRKLVENLDENLDFVIIDSLGMPVLSMFAKWSMKDRGEALLALIALLGDLKVWSYKSGGTAIVTNQPVSEIAGGKDRRPFGDKSQFAVKEIWKLDIEDKRNITKSKLRTFRSRNLPYNHKLADVQIGDFGVKVDWVKNQK